MQNLLYPSQIYQVRHVSVFFFLILYVHKQLQEHVLPCLIATCQISSCLAGNIWDFFSLSCWKGDIKRDDIAVTSLVVHKCKFIHIAMAMLNFLYILDYGYSVFQTLLLSISWWVLKSEEFFDSLLGGKQEWEGSSSKDSCFSLRYETGGPDKKRKQLSFNSGQWMKSNKRIEFWFFFPERGWVDLAGSEWWYSMEEVNLSSLQKDYLRMTIICKNLKSKVKRSSDTPVWIQNSSTWGKLSYALM